VLRHSAAEHRRLEVQAELVAPITRQLLVDAAVCQMTFPHAGARDRDCLEADAPRP
jgi:hypothetical protein